MNTLARRPLWLAIGWSLVVLVTALSLAPTSRLPDVDYNDKAGHLLAYVSLMAWFGQLYVERMKTALALVAMGALIEVFQGLSGYRDMSLFDQFANTAGIAAGWIFSRRFPDLLVRLEAHLP